MKNSPSQDSIDQLARVLAYAREHSPETLVSLYRFFDEVHTESVLPEELAFSVAAMNVIEDMLLEENVEDIKRTCDDVACNLNEQLDDLMAEQAVMTG